MRLPSLLFAVTLLTSVAPDARPEVQEERGAWSLHHGLLAAEKVEVHTTSPVLGGLMNKLIMKQGDAALPMERVPDGEPGDLTAPRIVLGTGDDPEARALANWMGVDLSEEGFSYLETDWFTSGDMLVATFEDPERPGLPVTLVFGNEAKSMGLQLPRVQPRWKPALRIWTRGELCIDGELSPDGRRLLPDHLDYREVRAKTARPVRTELHGRKVWLHGDLDLPRVASYLRQCQAAEAQVLTWFGVKESQTVGMHVYPSPEAMAIATGKDEWSSVNRLQERAHAVVAPGLPHDGGAACVRALAVSVAGDPAAGWMQEGLGLWASGRFWGEELAGWVARLHRANLSPTVAELVAPDAGRRVSPLVLEPMRAWLFGFLLRTRDLGEVREFWRGRTNLRVDKLLERSFRKDLDALLAERRKALAKARAKKREARKEVSFRPGVALVPQDHDDSHAFLSSGLAKSLEKARDLGAGAFSITVFAGQNAPAGEVSGGPFFSSATDRAIAAAIGRGRELKLDTMLVLSLLANPTGTVADVLLLEPEQEEEFFESYRAIAQHYALLAELNRCDFLCIGSELKRVSHTVVDAKNPEELVESRLEGWREVIAACRQVYSGGITYAANLRNEADLVRFWDELDYVGLHLYPQLSADGREPSTDEIRRTYRSLFTRALELSTRFERPALVVQTGYPSSVGSWQRSWVPHRKVDTEAQAKVFGALGAALNGVRAAQAEEFLAGLFLWNWSTDPDAGGPTDSGFTPQNKPAEALLPALFGE